MSSVPCRLEVCLRLHSLEGFKHVVFIAVEARIRACVFAVLSVSSYNPANGRRYGGRVGRREIGVFHVLDNTVPIPGTVCGNPLADTKLVRVAPDPRV